MGFNRHKRNRPLFASAVPLSVRKPKLRWRIGPIIWLGLKRTCMLLGALMLISLVSSAILSSMIPSAKAPSLPREMVLYLPLEDTLYERPIEPSFEDPFAMPAPTVHDLVDAIDRAAKDDRVKGLLARMDSGMFPLTRSAELRDAIKRFAETGKFTRIYSSSFGQGGGDLGRYYMASAFQEIWMQPMGVVAIPGVRVEVPFVRDTLDKIGITPQFYKRKEFKTAYESFTNRAMSDENRMELQGVVDGIRTQILKDIPKDRGMSPQAFDALVQRGLFTAPEAVAARLIDKADYADVLVEQIKTEVTGNPEASDDLFVDAESYLHAHASEKHAYYGLIARPQVALVHVVGAIMEDDVGSNPLMEDGIAAASTIAPAILDAAEDENIRALVLRVDSPGGSPGASESILRAIEKVKAKGKPVIVSMGEAAASGGYWVAAYADRIFAQPTTLTGSIGVLGGKVSGAQAWKTLGVNWDREIQWGNNAGMWSMNTPFSASEQERMNAMLDFIYASFVERVAKGRNLSPEKVDQIARGRVWTGAEAVKIGLVDEIGGQHEALNYVAGLLGQADKNAIEVVIMPAPKTTIERLIEMLEGGGSVTSGLRFQQRILSTLEPLAPALEVMGVLKANPGGAVYEPLRVE